MDRVRLLDGAAEAFPPMLEAIRGARHSVHLESYIFERDEAGAPFIEALVAAAQRGVRVSVAIDGWASRDARSIASDLVRAGARVRVHDGLLAQLLRGAMRNHRKLLLVDGGCRLCRRLPRAAARGRSRLPVEPVGAACKGGVDRRRARHLRRAGWHELFKRRAGSAQKEGTP